MFAEAIARECDAWTCAPPTGIGGFFIIRFNGLKLDRNRPSWFYHQLPCRARGVSQNCRATPRRGCAAPLSPCLKFGLFLREDKRNIFFVAAARPPQWKIYSLYSRRLASGL